MELAAWSPCAAAEGSTRVDEGLGGQVLRVAKNLCSSPSPHLGRLEAVTSWSTGDGLKPAGQGGHAQRCWRVGPLSPCAARAAHRICREAPPRAPPPTFEAIEGAEGLRVVPMGWRRAGWSAWLGWPKGAQGRVCTCVQERTLRAWSRCRPGAVGLCLRACVSV